MNKFLIWSWMLIVGSTPLLHAAVYWVSPTGSSDWSSCQSASDPGSNYCSLYTANLNVLAGDTVYLKGGAYTVGQQYDAAISPRHSGTGTGTGRIIFASAPNNTSENPPLISQANGVAMIGIDLGGYVTNSYIKIDGVTFKDFTYYFAFLRNSSSHNEIVNCSFVSEPGYEAGIGIVIAGSFDTPNLWSTDNWFHGNTFSKRQASDPCGEGVDLIQIGGTQNSPLSQDDHNTFENNYLEYGGHGTIITYGRFNVIRNNVMHNEPWITGCAGSLNDAVYVNAAYNGKYGHRNVALGDSNNAVNNYNLLEGNRVGFASTNPGNGGSTNVDIESPGNIVRYNFIFGGMDSGVYFKWANSFGAGTGAVNNRVFNNTIYHNGYGWDARTHGHMNASYSGQGIAQYSATNITSNPTLNVVKNNIVYDNGEGDICHLGLYTPPGNCSADTALDIVTNNWTTASGDPKFVNPDLSSPSSSNLPNLNLQANSGAINGGTNLTQTVGAGNNSTLLTVQDALYFQDGTWGSDLARVLGNFQADWISIGTVDHVAQIAGINYTNNTLTLASPMTWTNGAPVWLFKDSSGRQVLQGTAPDLGAYEYASGIGPAPSPTISPSATPAITPAPTATPTATPSPIATISIIPTPLPSPIQTGGGFFPFKNVFNPEKESITISYSIPSGISGDTTLTVYDRQGTKVKDLVTGVNSATWDGRNSDGQIVSSGTYVLILKKGDKTFKKKVVVIK